MVVHTLIFPVSLHPAEVDAQFTVPLSDKTVKEEEYVEFTAELTKPNVKVKWEKNGVVMKPGADDRIKMTSEGTTYKLCISKSMLDDEAKYSIVLPSEKKSSATLTVEGMKYVFQGLPHPTNIFT
jgi:hypothetical protein